jgi:hypothetical protein
MFRDCSVALFDKACLPYGLTLIRAPSNGWTRTSTSNESQSPAGGFPPKIVTGRSTDSQEPPCDSFFRDRSGEYRSPRLLTSLLALATLATLSKGFR